MGSEMCIRDSFLPDPHLMWILHRIIFYCTGRTAIRVAFAQDRINGTALYRVIAVTRRLFCVILWGIGGGGRPDMAQAGGPNADDAQAAIDAVAAAL